MQTEENKNKPDIQWSNPYNNDHHYVNKYSRKAWPALLTGVLVCLFFTAFAIWRWLEFNSWEQEGGSFSMYALEWLLYKASGKWGEAVLLVSLGVICLIKGFGNWQKRKQLKEGK